MWFFYPPYILHREMFFFLAYRNCTGILSLKIKSNSQHRTQTNIERDEWSASAVAINFAHWITLSCPRSFDQPRDFSFGIQCLYDLELHHRYSSTVSGRTYLFYFEALQLMTAYELYEISVKWRFVSFLVISEFLSEQNIAYGIRNHWWNTPSRHLTLIFDLFRCYTLSICATASSMLRQRNIWLMHSKRIKWVEHETFSSDVIMYVDLWRHFALLIWKTTNSTLKEWKICLMHWKWIR